MLHGQAPGSGSDSFTLDNPAVDLIFSADQSGSMDDVLASLARAFASFIGALNAVTVAWRILVATTTTAAPSAACSTPPPSK
jgi:hypothetical protein